MPVFSAAPTAQKKTAAEHKAFGGGRHVLSF
jgi:hypothetical protein